MIAGTTFSSDKRLPGVFIVYPSAGICAKAAIPPADRFAGFICFFACIIKLHLRCSFAGFLQEKNLHAQTVPGSGSTGKLQNKRDISCLKMNFSSILSRILYK